MIDKNATNHGFVCGHCGADVAPAATTARNHCPLCLWSRHVDGDTPGDRASTCGALMEPAAVFQKKGKWVVIHRCTTCGHEQPNRLAPDDNFAGVIDLTVSTNEHANR